MERVRERERLAFLIVYNLWEERLENLIIRKFCFLTPVIERERDLNYNLQ